VLLSTIPNVVLLAPTNSTVVAADKRGAIITDNDIQSLRYERILGSGAYKQVYLVTADSQKYALAVSRLREKMAVKDEVRGVQVAEQVHRILSESERMYFEQVYDWWFQNTSPAEFAPGELVFPNKLERSRKVPKQFIGSKWMVAIKPVYDMDLRSFMKKASIIYSLGPAAAQPAESVAGISLDNRGAVNLALSMLRVGSIMHSVSLVHRDIKPKNIMLWNGCVVVIDFGFAAFVNEDKEGHACIEQPGRVKGEVGYVLARDVVAYRGCMQGDVYAIGKTLYEVIFGKVHGDFQSARQEITSEAAHAENTKFRALLSDTDVRRSRFRLDKTTVEALLLIICGLCREDDPLSFAEAERILRGATANTLVETA